MKIVEFDPSCRKALVKEAIPVSVGVVFWLLLGAIILGDYQDWGDDFAQYFTHARNILWGRSWSHNMELFPAVMPAFPTLLALLISIFGDSFFPIAYTNCTLWAMTSVFAWLILRRHFQFPLFSVLCFYLVLFSPLVIDFQQSAIPNILYSCAIWITLYVIVNSIDARSFSWKRIVLLTTLICVSGLIRPTVLALCVALFLTGTFMRQVRLMGLSILCFGFVLAVQLLLSDIGGQKSYIGYFFSFLIGSARGGNEFHLVEATGNCIGHFTRLLFSNLNALTYGVIPSARRANDFSILSHVFLFGFLALLALAVRRHWRQPRFFFLTVFFVVHLAFISGYLQPSSDPRFMLPILPYFIFSLFLFCDSAYLRYSTSVKVIIASSIVLLFINLAIHDFGQRHTPRLSNRVRTPEFADFTRWYHEAMKDGTTLGFFKPRVLPYLIDRRDYLNPFTSRDVRELKDLKKFFAHTPCKDRVFLFLKPRGALSDTSKTILTYLANEQHIYNRWNNGAVSVFVKDAMSCPDPVEEDTEQHD